jgi:hypothetical protein
MPSDTDEDQRPPLPVDNTLNALDEVQAAMDRVVAEKRTARRRIARDHLARGEDFRERRSLTLNRRIPYVR